MLLVSFTVWGIVCLRHSWKAMWTRLADWLVMSNSLPQREDEPLCGLHGWDASMWVQSCTRMCGDPLKTRFFSFTFRTRLSRRSTSHSYHLSTFKQGSGVSVRSEWHTWSRRGRHSFGAERDESGGLRMWTRAFIQRLHRAIFQRALLTPSLSLLHVQRELIVWPTPQRANIKVFKYSLYLITSINYKIQKRLQTWSNEDG